MVTYLTLYTLQIFHRVRLWVARVTSHSHMHAGIFSYVEKWRNNCMWVVFIIGVVLNFEVAFVHWILSTFYVVFIYWVIFILWVCPIVNFVIQRATILKIEKNLICSVAIVQCDTMLYNRVGCSWGHKQVDTGTGSYV